MLGRLAWLSFAAMLLLLVMPTAGRLLAGFSDGAFGIPLGMTMPADTVSALHGHSQASEHVAADHSSHAGHPGHGDGHAGNGCCPYCPLLTNIIDLLVPLVVPVALLPPQHRPLVRQPAVAALSLPGLGARGPPALL